ncbi:MAG: cysteine desulfurase family protein [Eubacteriales bacterium]|nr:cysteine desulfurase family protein [Eubacteriales bacterium]
MIYADNAATTKMSKAAIEAMLPFFDTLYGNPGSPHEAGRRAQEALWHAREQIAAVLHCSAKQIYFTSGGSEADNQALCSAAAIGERSGKRHIISTAIEHPAVLKPLEQLKKRGFDITLLPVHADGIVRPAELIAAIRPDTALVSVMYANNEIGTIQPVQEIGALCRERGILFHSDAVQAAGQLPVNIPRDGIDLLALSAHKFHGPKGIGVLYADVNAPLKSLILGGEQERGRRAGTENVAAIAGMAAALAEANASLDRSHKHLSILRERMLTGLLAIPGTRINGSLTKRLPGNINISFEGIEAELLLLLLSEHGICASSGSACASGSMEPSHVLLALGLSPTEARGALRLTLSGETTEDEADQIVCAVSECVSRLRNA